MLPNTQYLRIKPTAQASVFSKKKLTSAMMLIILLSLGMLLVATQSHAAEDSLAKVNLYEKNYKEQNGYHLKSQSNNPDTQMFVSNHKDEDNISMLEKGYDMMGSSGFDAENVPAELALQFGKEIKADTVLVYSKYGSAKTTANKLKFIKEAAKKGGEIDPKDMMEEPTNYEYYASYWAKIPMPLLGVHVIKLIQSAQEEDSDNHQTGEEKGLKIIAVILKSPADKANILKGDTLLKVGDVSLTKPEDLFAAVKHYAGQTVPVEIQRGDEDIKTKVVLNSLK